jgi:hypothetical protein
MSRQVVLLCAVVLTGVGCGGGKIALKGEVTFDGQPVPEGSISFEPADGKGPVTGGVITAGAYRLEGEAGTTPGEKVVRITAVRKTGRKVPIGEGTGLTDEIVPYIPSRYNSQSQLRVQVVPGKVNTHDFRLAGSGPKGLN